MDRPVDRLSVKQRFLIVCEGEQTEPNYFLKFPIPKDSVVRVEGVGANTEYLVRTAIMLRAESWEQNQIRYDQVWCVFDRDSFEAYHFNQALDLAKKNQIEVAYSNEAFELWYVLHFQYLDTGITREDYIKCLSLELKRKYEKNDPNIYDELLPRQQTAIQFAKTLLNQYQPKNPEKDKPSTTVHILVEKLNELNWDRWKHSN